MSTDVLYPLLIGGGCVVAAFMVHLLTRPKPSRADITLPEGTRSTPDPAASAASGASASALIDWHRSNEAALLDYFEYHDRVGASSIKPGDDDTQAVSAAFEEAYASHPAPDMRAELAATRAAADAMALAKDRDDQDAISRHGDVYFDYRAAWLERLWQFARDRHRIARLREDDMLA